MLGLGAQVHTALQHCESAEISAVLQRAAQVKLYFVAYKDFFLHNSLSLENLRQSTPSFSPPIIIIANLQMADL